LGARLQPGGGAARGERLARPLDGGARHVGELAARRDECAPRLPSCGAGHSRAPPARARVAARERVAGMSVLVLLIPLGLLMLGIAVWAFFWAVANGQFDDLSTPALSVVMDDDAAPPAPRSEDGR